MKKKILFAIKKLKQVYFGLKVKKKAKSYGKNLKVNWKSNVNNQTILGNNVNFNGMEINGKGSVVIGDNFHSGKRYF